MEFVTKVQFLGIEEQRVDDGQLFRVRVYAGSDVVDFYVNGKNPFVVDFNSAKFGDEFMCLFALVPHPKTKGAFKLRFSGIVEE